MNSRKETDLWALIVDDNAFNREIFRYALQASDYRASEAGSAVEAMKLLESRCFDLMVLDLQMPFMNGGAVLRAVRTTPAHAKMNVIVATANPHMAVGEIEDMADYVVVKPIDVHVFATLIGRLRGATHMA